MKDLIFYPSYGDTYPMYNGAVGMTIEQAEFVPGREVTMENGKSYHQRKINPS